MSHYKAIVSDIDGTLTPIVRGALPSEAVSQAIKNSIQNGAIFCLASGRPFHLVQYLAEYLNLESPCIVDNGAAIVNGKTGAVIWEAILSNSDANKILQLVKDFKLVRTSTDAGGTDNPTSISENEKVRKISVHDISLTEAEELISKVTAEFHEVAAIKAASYEAADLVDVYFSDAKATKQYAVVKLAEILNLSPEEIIGIGDGYNDFPLLMACGLKVAMGNAVEDLKAIADEVAPSVEADGLAFILKKYLNA